LQHAEIAQLGENLIASDKTNAYNPAFEAADRQNIAAAITATDFLFMRG
jgi:methylthioribose-1-phosphate isomerase